MRIQPAVLLFDASGTPFAPAYGDVYHSTESGPGQAQHVFIAGNDLPGRWAHARVFTILETGFGFGLNFLTTWREWLRDPARPERLHFVSIEKHPFERDDLRQLHARYDTLGPLAEQLQRAWPPLVSGLHRLHFEAERITLTLAFGDAVDVVSKLHVCADAIYLDGFSPEKNPQMWSPQLMKRLARLARPGTTVATYSIAGIVRSGLAAAGFVVERRSGFGRKREMLSARFEPRWSSRDTIKAAPSVKHRHAIVVGGGLAGAAVCMRLAARGWQLDLIERRPHPASRASGGFAGVFQPHVSRDDCILSRIARNGYLYAVSRWEALRGHIRGSAWERCGVLQLPRQFDEEPWMREALAVLSHPLDYVEYVEKDRAEALSGIHLHSGGWWFPGAGWARPSNLIAAQIAEVDARQVNGTLLTTHFDVTAHTIARGGEGWQVFDIDGTLIATAPVLILANAHDVTRLASLGHPLKRIRGQVTYVPAESCSSPRVVLTGTGYVLPAACGVVLAGSTYDYDDEPMPRMSGHEANLNRVSRLLPNALDESIAAADLDGAVGFRCVAADRMPVVGAVPDIDEARRRRDGLRGPHLSDVPRQSGLYCASGFASRGLIWAELAGEMLGSLLEGEPLPLESDLAAGVDPGRFLLRQLRQRSLRSECSDSR